MVKYHPQNPQDSARVLQILKEEGVIARLSEDGLPHSTNNLDDMLSQVREELPERKKYNSFSTPNEGGSKGKRKREGSKGEGSEREWEGEGPEEGLEEEKTGADAMELMDHDPLYD